MLWDVTNPAVPFQASDWGIQDTGGPFYGGQGCDPDANYGHGAEPSEDGDAHSAQYDEGRKLLFAADEDFCKTSGAGIEKGFGYLRVYDFSKPSTPRQIGSYRRSAACSRTRRRSGGVAVDEATGLVHASDMNSGLWILKRTD